MEDLTEIASAACGSLAMTRALGRSKFRSIFKLDGKDKAYIKRLGLAKIEAHARDFITARLAPARPKKDGKQTPHLEATRSLRRSMPL